MKDLMLNTVSHDLVITGYDLLIIDGINQVKQNVKIRLLFLYEEWFLDSNKGVPYFEQLCTKNPDIGIVDSFIKATISETPGVTQILEYSSEYSAGTRSLEIAFKLLTEFGDTTIQSLTLG